MIARFFDAGAHRPWQLIRLWSAQGHRVNSRQRSASVAFGAKRSFIFAPRRGVAERPSKRKGETRVEFIRRAVEREIERAAREKLRPPKV